VVLAFPVPLIRGVTPVVVSMTSTGAWCVRTVVPVVSRALVWVFTAIVAVATIWIIATLGGPPAARASQLGPHQTGVAMTGLRTVAYVTAVTAATDGSGSDGGSDNDGTAGGSCPGLVCGMHFVASGSSGGSSTGASAAVSWPSPASGRSSSRTAIAALVKWIRLNLVDTASGASAANSAAGTEPASEATPSPPNGGSSPASASVAGDAHSSGPSHDPTRAALPRAWSPYPTTELPSSSSSVRDPRTGSVQDARTTAVRHDATAPASGFITWLFRLLGLAQPAPPNSSQGPAKVQPTHATATPNTATPDSRPRVPGPAGPDSQPAQSRAAGQQAQTATQLPGTAGPTPQAVHQLLAGVVNLVSAVVTTVAGQPAGQHTQQVLTQAAQDLESAMTTAAALRARSGSSSDSGSGQPAAPNPGRDASLSGQPTDKTSTGGSGPSGSAKGLNPALAAQLSALAAALTDAGGPAADRSIKLTRYLATVGGRGPPAQPTHPTSTTDPTSTTLPGGLATVLRQLTHQLSRDLLTGGPEQPDPTAAPAKTSGLRVPTADGATLGITPSDPPNSHARITADEANDRYLITAQDSQAPDAYQFTLSMPAGAHAVLNRAGGVDVIDPHGQVSQALAAPWAYDAAGNPVPTYFTVQGSTLTQHIQPSANSLYPILADPAAASSPAPKVGDPGYQGEVHDPDYRDHLDPTPAPAAAPTPAPTPKPAAPAKPAAAKPAPAPAKKPAPAPDTGTVNSSGVDKVIPPAARTKKPAPAPDTGTVNSSGVDKVIPLGANKPAPASADSTVNSSEADPRTHPAPTTAATSAVTAAATEPAGASKDSTVNSSGADPVTHPATTNPAGLPDPAEADRWNAKFTQATHAGTPEAVDKGEAQAEAALAAMNDPNADGGATRCVGDVCATAAARDGHVVDDRTFTAQPVDQDPTATHSSGSDVQISGRVMKTSCGNDPRFGWEGVRCTAHSVDDGPPVQATYTDSKPNPELYRDLCPPEQGGCETLDTGPDLLLNADQSQVDQKFRQDGITPGQATPTNKLDKSAQDQAPDVTSDRTAPDPWAPTATTSTVNSSGVDKVDPEDAQHGGAALTNQILLEGKQWTGTGRSGGHLPKTAAPNSILYRLDPQTGTITNYSTYDENGNIVKRVDLNHAHGPYENGHTHIYGTNRAPNGKEYPGQEIEVRPAQPGEIPGN
jgi:hypothetical protein